MGKKLYYYVVIGLIVCLVLVVIRQFNIQDSIEEIDYDEFVAKINNDENFTVIIGRDDCPYCDKLKNYIIDSGIDVLNPVYLKYSDENKDVFLNQIETYFDNIQVIPYYAMIENGEIKNTGQGFKEESDFVAFLRQM